MEGHVSREGERRMTLVGTKGFLQPTREYRDIPQ